MQFDPGGSVSKPLQTVQIDDETWQSEIYEEGISGSVISGAAMEALTLFEVVERYHTPTNSSTLSSNSELIYLKVWPKTGRRHQIRVHLASLGRPLVGDLTYGDRATLGSGRLFLHCRSIRLRDLQGDPFQVEAALPEELLQILEQLEKSWSCSRAVSVSKMFQTGGDGYLNG